jgi:transcriptional regulator with XRE-family HTH domain
MSNIRHAFENELVQFLITEYFNGDSKRLAEHTGYSKQQIDIWISGNRKPRKATIRYLLSATLAPELKIVKEFFPVSFSSNKEIRSKLKDCLGEHEKSKGVYAFYDSLCNLFYVGKAATCLFDEMYQQLRGPLGIKFPKALSKPPEYRWQATAFISAYEVPLVEHLDYPKHVESLVLRLSKPIGNKILGNLNVAERPKDDG